MNKLSKESFDEIRLWIYRNARPLDLALWKYHFENGSKEDVLLVLSFYQNEDGGFGNSIEPSAWKKESTPYNVWFAIRILKMIEFYDMTHPIYQGIFRYLENTEYKADFGWHFITPGGNWDGREHENHYQSIGITAILSGLILRYQDKQSTIYNMAVQYTKMLIGKLSTNQFGDMGIQGYCKLIEDLEAAEVAEAFDYPYLCEKMKDIVWNKIHDKTNDFFMENPLMFVFSPRSRFYEDNRKEVEAELDQITNELPSKGVWELPWKESSEVSANWWKSFEAIDKLVQLKQFNRI
ncbi:MAG: hypothetical protein K0S41_1443 [Anaerocolumna sp.]|jgi:hypothetical protein|nr:hypothetical protein [Anaerocolumna sp.]